jgi:hypothetical protein
MRYILSRPNEPPRADLDGEFEGYQTLDGLPLENYALTLLRRCAYLVGPIMRRHGWAAPLLSEIYLDKHPNLAGYHKSWLSPTKRIPMEIALRLREPENMHKFIPIDEIMQIMLHELTHFENVDHDLSFYTSNARLLAELRDDVSKGRLRLMGKEIPAVIRDVLDIRQHLTHEDIRNIRPFSVGNKAEWARLAFSIICTIMIFVSVVEEYNHYSGGE